MRKITRQHRPICRRERGERRRHITAVRWRFPMLWDDAYRDDCPICGILARRMGETSSTAAKTCPGACPLVSPGLRVLCPTRRWSGEEGGACRPCKGGIVCSAAVRAEQKAGLCASTHARWVWRYASSRFLQRTHISPTHLPKNGGGRVGTAAKTTAVRRQGKRRQRRQANGGNGGNGGTSNVKQSLLYGNERCI